MTVQANFSISRYEDGILAINLESMTPIGGWHLQFSAAKHFGGSGFIFKSSISGRDNVSGIQITNSGLGQFNIYLNSQDTSGLCFGNYAYSIERLDSGSRTVLTEGFMSVMPNVG